jgi:hypothetical protein
MACPNMRGGCRTDLGALVWCRALASFSMRTRPPIKITANFFLGASGSVEYP